jgi:hypothetical protein
VVPFNQPDQFEKGWKGDHRRWPFTQAEAPSRIEHPLRHGKPSLVLEFHHHIPISPLPESPNDLDPLAIARVMTIADPRVR